MKDRFCNFLLWAGAVLALASLLLSLSALAMKAMGAEIFVDSFEGPKVEDPGPKPLPFLNGFYHACNPWNGCEGSPGNFVSVWAPGSWPGDNCMLLQGLIDQARAEGKLILLPTASPCWRRFVDEEDVIGLSAMDEPDYLEVRFHPRPIWDQYLAELREIKTLTDKPVFCNFAALAQNGLKDTLVRHLPNHPDFVKSHAIRQRHLAKRREIPVECDWVGYTPSYGSPDTGPFLELKALGRPILFLMDALHQTPGWNYHHPRCSNDSNCEVMRAQKLRIIMDAMEGDSQFVGVYTFLWGDLINEGGGGLDRQPRYLQPAYAEYGLFPRERVNVRAGNLITTKESDETSEEAEAAAEWPPKSPHGYPE